MSYSPTGTNKKIQLRGQNGKRLKKKVSSSELPDPGGKTGHPEPPAHPPSHCKHSEPLKKALLPQKLLCSS